jgi:methylenetetrahydrofolate reductase (NADPH)
MKIADMLRGAQAPFPSLEIVPPLNGLRKDQLLNTIGQFMEFAPRYINVTCHRDQFEYRQEADGSYSRHLVRSRLSPVAVCAAVMSKYPVEMVPHVICAGVTEEEIYSQLYDYHFLGIENVMALRGDSMQGENRFTPTPGGFRHANELVEAIRRFEGSIGASFSVGVGGYPEKHFEAANLTDDIARLKAKVDAGADYVITQMFFDNAVFYRFTDACRAAGINVPIVPGLKPLSNRRQLELLPSSFSIDIPKELTGAVNAAATEEEVYAIGTDWCIAQCKDLLSHGVPAVHFYTMGKSRNIEQVLRSCFQLSPVAEINVR